MSLSRKRGYEIDYFSYTVEKYVITSISETYKKVYVHLKKEFDDKQFFTVDRTNEEDKYLVVVTSDKIVGEYYVSDM